MSGLCLSGAACMAIVRAIGSAVMLLVVGGAGGRALGAGGVAHLGALLA